MTSGVSVPLFWSETKQEGRVGEGVGGLAITGRASVAGLVGGGTRRGPRRVPTGEGQRASQGLECKCAGSQTLELQSHTPHYSAS